MRYIPIDSEPQNPRLGRYIPDNFDHIEKWGFSSPEASITPINNILRLPHWHRLHNQFDQGSCFPAGTLIRLVDGSQKFIEDVKLLDVVATAEGRSGKVLQTMVHYHKGSLVKIKAWGHSHLRATPEHPILTKRGYIPIGELEPGDEIALPKPLLTGVRECLTERFVEYRAKSQQVKAGLREYPIVGTQQVLQVQVKPIPKEIKLTSEFGQIVGLWLAEGSTSKNKVTWHFGQHESPTLVAGLVHLLKTEFDLDAQIQNRGNNSVNVNVYGVLWSEFFRNAFSHGPYEKTLPSEMALSNSEFLAGVMKGWTDGDGHYRRQRQNGVTVSHRLAMQMHTIGTSLGNPPCINETVGKPNRAAKSRRNRWDIEFPDSVNFRGSQDTTHIWRTVRAIEKESWSGFVFNMEIEGDNSYVAEGIGVHNCVGFGVSMQMAIVNFAQRQAAGKRPYTVRYDPWWLWDNAKRVDDWPETNPGDNNGTSVSAAMDILRDMGHIRQPNTRTQERTSGKSPDPAEGISANRWATTVDDMRGALDSGIPISIGVNWYSNFDTPELDGRYYWIGRGNIGHIRGGHCVCIYGASDRRQAFRIKNSWGENYPLVWLPYSIMGRLLNEYGEAALIVDK